MLNSPISHSEDLLRLKEAGYHIEIRGAYLIAKNILYVVQDSTIKRADIVTSLCVDPSTNQIKQPKEHTVWWTGEIPYTIKGESMKEELCCEEFPDGFQLGEEIIVYMKWSRKPKQGGTLRSYKDYFEQIKTYVDEVSFHAESKTPGILKSSKLGKITEVDVDTNFTYMNTSLYRNGTKGIEDKISDEIIAVIGVGGTGSYLVDILAKTNVKELHLYDDDIIEPDSAFRLAGAVNKNELHTTKVEWHQNRYKNVRKKGLYIYKNKIDSNNLDILKKFTTVFIAVDNLKSRREIQEKCNEMGIFHLSVGIGIEVEGKDNNQLGGMVKIEREYQVPNIQKKVGSESNEQRLVNDIYRSNIQTAELNMLGASLALIEWKIKKGIYRNDREKSDNIVNYTISFGKIFM